ncbi:hypothetical protein UlMin_032418 [Ulmus minor]
MADERVKTDALQIMGMFQVLPRLVVFDLDYTLWPFYCECRPNSPYLYNDARGILHAFKEKGVGVAIASRSPTENRANKFLEELRIKSMFVAQEIFPSPVAGTHKKKHFQNIHSRTGIPYSNMLFFDDENRNIQAVSKLGVTSILVGNGVNLGALRQGLAEYCKGVITIEKNKQRWRKFSGNSSSSKKNEPK